MGKDKDTEATVMHNGKNKQNTSVDTEQNKSPKLKTKKSKKCKPVKNADIDSVDTSSIEITLTNEIVSDNLSSDEKPEKQKNVNNSKKKKNKRNKSIKEEENQITKAKKIKFVNDEPVVVKAKVESPQKKQRLNDDEEDVKDEDIDAFCDGLDEKDNEVYENWVKLFEDNFRSNKKKT